MKRLNSWLTPLVVTGLVVVGIAASLHYTPTPTGNVYQQRLTELLTQRGGWSNVYLGPLAKIPDRWVVRGRKSGIEFRGECHDLDPDTLCLWVYPTSSRPGLRGNEDGIIAALFFEHPNASWSGQPLPPAFHREMTGLANELQEALREVVDAPNGAQAAEFPRPLEVKKL